MSRKSGRQRKPSRKVAETEDPFQQVDELSAEDESEKEEHVVRREAIDGEDSDFPVAIAANDQDQDLADSDPASEFSDSPNTSIPAEEDKDTHARARYESNVHVHMNSKRKNQFSAKDHSVRSRGLTERQHKNPEDRIILLAGPDQAEIGALEETRSLWGADHCLPRRERMHHAFAHPQQQKTREAQEGWNWYYEQGGKEGFADRQKMHVLSAEEGCMYLAGASQDLLVGPYGNQKLFKLDHMRSYPLDAPWEGTLTDTAAAAAGLNSNQQSDRTRRRHGWMLNVGTRAQSLDWAPNHEGDIQYLSIASSQTSGNFIKEPSKTAPAFSPAASTPSSIQIWALDISDLSETKPDLKKTTTPKLLQVLCSNWGDVKQLKWCPIPREDRQRGDRSTICVGLLAGIWGDGYARVVDVKLSKLPDNKATYLKIENSAFACRSENAICTSLSWLSPTDLAIGHSDGSVKIYDICPPPNPTTINTAQTGAPQLPSPSHQIPDPRHPSPILTLASAYPTHPTLLATSSIAGHERLLDLRAPLSDYVLAPRTRFPTNNLIYSPHLLSFVYNEESDGTIRSSGLRCWAIDRTRFAKTASSRGNSEDKKCGIGPLGRGCLDVGKVHSCVAWGGPDGRVMVCNPVKTVLASKREKAEVWQVCVFRQEWARRKGKRRSERASSPPSANETAAEGGDGDVEMMDPDAGEREARGVSRITQSYKAEKVDFGRGRGEKPAYLTMFEEENGVSAVCWNPNLRSGGWLAVGWGSGLVRVEDVAI